MKRRASILLALAVALAFAGSTSTRHARAAASNHDDAAAHRHAHHVSDSGRSHAHAAVAASVIEDNAPDHAGTAPSPDQSCCYAWCHSAALAHFSSGPVIAALQADLFVSEQPFRISAVKAALDPPPR